MSKIVDRTLDFLELFAKEQRPLTLTDIARLLDIPLSSCHDVLRTLQARGYLYEVGQRAGFYPTLRLRDIADDVAANDPILIRAEEQLRQLRDELGESVSLAKATGGRMTYLLVLGSAAPLRFQLVVGTEVRSYYATSAGKAFLASLPPDELSAYFDKTRLLPLTSHTKTDADELTNEIRASEEKGWFVNVEESVEGVVTVSARFSWNGAVYVATASGPISRMRERIETVGAQISEVCHKLGAGMSGV
ncbi:IclR family transcriptional regulator [Rhodococcus koreensis]|uniref:IclR family transcriptional regulator n=1 Tax=Rhodococcus koreensis TaxID=99653 RepID=UPI00366E1113